ncbi:MAG: hypothetical protein U1C33_04955, partial [Candidatus Cloacimonadaceae bacterium]|nr:hypothetical protein [Candidatus Cloacimonadaceae bacterium]
MLKKTFLLLIVLMAALVIWGQTNPTPQTLPYSQDFSALLHSGTAYPAGWQGWTVAGNPGNAFKTTTPSADRALT